jgi:hypothetical protein
LQSQAADRQSAQASLAGQMEKQAEENAPDPNVYTDAQGRTVPKGYAFNAKGQLQSLGTVGSTGASSGKGKSFTPGQRAKFIATSYETAKAVADNPDGVPDPDNPGQWIIPPGRKPVEILHDLVGHGVPFQIAVRQIAKFFPVANQWYGQGLKKSRSQKRAQKRRNEANPYLNNNSGKRG